MGAGAVLVVGLILGLIGAPLAGAVIYQFGGTYTHEAYPLSKAHSYLQQALAYIPYNPQGIISTTQTAWGLTNQSDNATGDGSGSPCWLWPQPDQTYGYLDAYYANIISSTSSWVASESNGTVANFHNTTLTNWGQIGAAVEQAQSVTMNIQGCVFFGNQASFTWLGLDIAWLVIGVPLMTYAAARVR